jgi:hypothetical protein
MRSSWMKRVGPFFCSFLILTLAASSVNAARAQDVFSGGDGGDSSDGSQSGGPAGGTQSQGSSGPNLNDSYNNAAVRCAMVKHEQGNFQNFPSCQDPKLIAWCKKQPPSPACIAIIADENPKSQMTIPGGITQNSQTPLPATKKINGKVYKKAIARGVEGYYDPTHPFYNGSSWLPGQYGDTTFTVDLRSSADKNRALQGSKKNVSAFSGQIVSLNVGKDDVITSVEFSADAAKAVGDYNKDAPVITLNHSPTPAVEPAHK